MEKFTFFDTLRMPRGILLSDLSDLFDFHMSRLCKITVLAIVNSPM